MKGTKTIKPILVWTMSVVLGLLFVLNVALGVALSRRNNQVDFVQQRLDHSFRFCFCQLAEHLKKFNDLSQTPIILVSQVIRGYFSKMITQFYPNLYVLSFNEVTNNVQIQSLGNITLGATARPERQAEVS